MIDASTPLSDSPPRALFEGGRLRAGRYLSPIPDPRFPPRRGARFRLKEWHYLSVTTDRYFVALALVQLGYAANAFAYLVDRDDPSKFIEFESLSPLGLALDFGVGSSRGRSLWRQRRAHLEILSAPSGWKIELDLPLGGSRLRGTIEVDAGEALCLAAPLAHDRSVYTHKAAALKARGALELAGDAIDLEGGLAVVDWTRSEADHRTKWKWASFSHRDAAGRRLGLNLSDGVYVDAHGDSPENAWWMEGKVEALGGVHFELPPDPTRGEWRVRSRRGDEVDLRFRPLGARELHLDLKLLKSDFVQPFGVFEGRVRGQPIEGAFGVVEDHLSVW